MTRFSATDAALEGFRIARQRPRILLAWAAFSFFASMMGAVITLVMPEEARLALESLASDETPDPGALLQALVAVSPILLMGLVVQRMMDGAVYRVILRPDESRFAFLRLGMDEVRLTALRLIFLMLAVLFIAVVQFGIAILAFAVSPFGGAAMLFVAGLAELFAWAMVLVLAVRLSLASVMTFDRRRLSIFESWEVTRGLFWPLFGTYILALCCAAALGLLAFALSGAVLLITGGSFSDLTSMMQSEPLSLKTYLNPFVIAYTVIGNLFTAIYSAMIPAPGAFAYKAVVRDVEPAPDAEAVPA